MDRGSWCWFRGGVAAAAIFLSFALLLAACGGDETPTTDVEISFAEWEITTTLTESPAGEVTFEVRNDDAVAHEFVVVKNDLPPSQLPVEDERVNEAIVNIEGRLPPVEPGGAASLTLSLTPGKYVLICNLFDEAPGEGHYRQGMYTGFLVEP